MQRGLQIALFAALLTLGLCWGIVPSARADSVVAWGQNNDGQLGNGSTTNSDVPVPVSGLSVGISTIAAGGFHGLAIQNGGITTWGLNNLGQLGNGTQTNSDVPVAVSGLMSGVTAIAGGLHQSLAIQNGAVWLWGSFVYALPFGNFPDPIDSTIPIPVSGLTGGVTAIAGGGSDGSLAIQNGGVWSFGTYPLSTNAPVAVAVNGLSTGVTAIAAGSTSLAIQNGGVWTWTNPDLTTAISSLSTGVTAIAAGGSHNLAVQNGGVWAWGSNASGQLGNGNTTSSATPIQVDPTDLTNIIAVAASAESSFALSADGSIWDWGDNTYGELGINSTTADFFTPQHLLPPSGYIFTSLSAEADGDTVVATLESVPEPAPTIILSLSATMACLMARHRRRA